MPTARSSSTGLTPTPGGCSSPSSSALDISDLVLKQFGLTPNDPCARWPDPEGPSHAVAAEARTDASNATWVVDGSKGLASSAARSGDRRVKLVAPTPAG
jgi:hypothetical protein